MDGFTAAALLGALKNGANNNDVADLYAALKGEDNPPTHEQVGWFNANQGKKVSVDDTSHIGIVHKLNNSRSGLYPGGCYPIYVKMIGGENIDSVFEYGIEQLTIID
jgi:hypothetical protein